MTDEDVPGAELQRVFGENFRAARLTANMSQGDVGELTGMTRQAISRIESGKVNATIATLDRLARTVAQDVMTLLDKSYISRQQK